MSKLNNFSKNAEPWCWAAGGVTMLRWLIAHFNCSNWEKCHSADTVRPTDAPSLWQYLHFIWVNKLWYQSSCTWSDGVAYFNRLVELVSYSPSSPTIIWSRNQQSFSRQLAAELSWVLVLAGLVWYRPMCVMRMRRKLQKWKWNLWPVPLSCASMCLLCLL